MNMIINYLTKAIQFSWRKLVRSECFSYLVIRIVNEINYAKLTYIKKTLRQCGENVNFQFPVYICQPDCIEIGNNVSIAAYIHIWGSGGVKIGDRVMIGSHTAISSLTHDYCSKNMYNSILAKPVVIGNDVWIGTHAVILPGIVIGEGAIIGAGCIVTKNVEPFAVVVGVPGQAIKKRELS